MVPLTDTMPLVRETTISSDTRPVMANKVNVINLRKYPRPYDSGDFIEDIVLPFYERCHTAEFAFYVQKIPFCLEIPLG